MSGTVSGAQLRAFIERIERLEEEKRTISDDIKDVKAEAKGCGFDVPTINAIIKLRKKDAAERDEAQAMLDMYMAALGMLPLFERTEPAGQSYADQKGRGEAKLVETIVKGVQTEIGRKALVTALDIMIDSETGEVIEDQPEADTEFHPPVTTREGHQGDPSPTLGETDLAEVGTGQKRAVLPQEPYTATNHQSTGVLPAGGSSPSASEIDEIAELAQPSPPKQAEPIKAGEGALPSSPAILSDEEVVPAFMKDKPGCLKLRDGHCKIGFATEALCAECAHKRAVPA